jgi:hypothetical protein
MAPLNEGLSTSRDCGASAACLYESGHAFVVRHYSRITSQSEKRLNAAEAAILAGAGLKIVAAYQDRAREPQELGRERGEQDGMSAFLYAAEAGQPVGSAIYFTVDADFTEAHLRAFVLPYFAGIKAAFEKAAPNAPSYRIGVHGSGLACRLLTSDLYYVEFTWLAQAAGWRESADYSDWKIKQFVNRGDIRCALGTEWERCVAQSWYGQFVPIGLGPNAAAPRPLMVAARALNLRAAPTTLGGAPLLTLPQGAIVDVLGGATPGWVRVRSRWNGELAGYVVRRYLAEPTAAALAAPVEPPGAGPGHASAGAT